MKTVKDIKQMMSEPSSKEWFAKHGTPKSKALHHKESTPASRAQANLNKHFKSDEFKKHLAHGKELEGRKESYYKFLKNPHK